MPACLLGLLLRLGVPLAIKLLVRVGLLNKVEASAISAAFSVRDALANLKTYREYPGDKPEVPAAKANFTTGRKLEP